MFRPSPSRRRGAIVFITALLMIVMMAFVAFAVDVGYLYTMRSQLQRSADSAAVAACWELIDEESVSQPGNMTMAIADARANASQFASLNAVGNAAPSLAAADVVVGYLSDPSNPASTIDAAQWTRSNAVQVSVRRHQGQNGEVPLFFARVLGFDSLAMQADATAALVTNIGGFRQITEGESNLEILPFALDEQTWDGMLAGGGTDDYKWNSQSNMVQSGGDGFREINLYPQGTGSPGNRGTIDIGGANNSTNDIARQIVEGISPSDMQAMVDQGRTLKLNSDGKLWLNGDTGISAGVKDELDSIKGKPRIIPIFRTVAGNGNNAEYTIVKFAGVRIMYVKLTGSMSSKKVIIQPCAIVSRGTVPAPSDTASSYYIFSPPWLVR